ncbi:MAG: hypothetical protein EOP11_18805, partial [Proteobacteria bacterium]
MPIANGGTGANSVAQNLIFASPVGSTGAPSFRALAASDLPASASFWQAGTPGINYGGGNVGIGTTAPAAALHAIGSIRASDAAGNKTAELNNDGGIELMRTTGATYIDFKNASTDDVDARIYSLSDDFRFSTGGNGSLLDRLTISSAGNVGIGTTSPVSRLQVSDLNRTDTATTSIYSNQFLTSMAPASASDTNLYSIRSQLDTQSSTAHNYTGTLAGAYLRANFNGTGTGSYVFGSYNVAANSSTGTITNARGTYSRVANSSTGMISTAVGAYTLADNLDSGSVGASYGLYAQSSNDATGSITNSHGVYARSINSSTGTITSSFGLRSQVYNVSTGTIGSASGVYVDLANAGGTVSNWYGLHLSDAGVSPTYFAIYSPGNTKSYLNGNLGLGISSPSAYLHLKAGTATASTAPLKFTAGTVLTSPENGAFEYDGTNYYLTVGTTRLAIPLAGGSASYSSVNAGAGTAAAPSHSFTGDPDTGIFSSGADSIGLTAGGSKVFDVSSAGLVSPTTGGASVASANGTAATPTYSFAATLAPVGSGPRLAPWPPLRAERPPPPPMARASNSPLRARVRAETTPAGISFFTRVPK